MNPEEEKELFLRVVTQLAASLLPQGGFMPFGAVLVPSPSRKVVLIRPTGVKKDVTRQELDRYWAKQLRLASVRHNCKTVCWCGYVGIQERSLVTPAILIHVERPATYSEDLLYPCSVLNSQASFKAPRTYATSYCVFTDA